MVEIVVRLKIDEKIWRDVKSSAVSRREPVQEFAANILWTGLRLIDEKECVLEDALIEAEQQFLSKGFRVLRGGATLFQRDRVLLMELMKENIHIHVSYYGIFAERGEDYAIAGRMWGPEDLDRQEIEDEKEKKIVLDALQIAKATFSGSLKEYSRFGRNLKEKGRLL